MKKIFSFLMVACLAIGVSAKQYCHETLTNAGGKTIQLSCEQVSEGNYRITIEGENLAGLGGSFFNPGAQDLRTAITSSTSTQIVCDIASATAPNLYTPLYVLMPGEASFPWPNDIEWGSCEGVTPTPDPEPETDPAIFTCAGQDTEASQFSFSTGYKYEFQTVGNAVKVTFELLDDKAGVVAYLWDYTSGFAETQMQNAGGKKFTITLNNQTAGATLRLACKFAYAGGMAVTKQFEYTVGTLCPIYDTNFALASNGASAIASTGNAAAAIDGNNGSRWESASTDTEWWILDMGQQRLFNTIQIRWEGAYTKVFDILATNDTTAAWTTIKQVNRTLGTPNNFEESIEFAEDQQYRFIKFQAVTRGTGWGNSFFEFRVLYPGVADLTTLTLSAAAANAKVGATVNLTLGAKDQNGRDMSEFGTPVYTVTPATAGTIAGNVFTAAEAGHATISATVGEVVSNTVAIDVYDGDKVDIFANYQSMVTAINDETTTGSMANAFDANRDTEWALHGGTAGDAAARTYTVGFQIDFGSLWDVTAISARYEGACAADYAVIAVDMNGVEDTLYSVVGHAGMATYDEFYLVDAKNTHFLKWVSTKAATQYGVKVKDFTVYAKNNQQLADSEAPTGLTATVAGKTFCTVDLELQANDNVSSVIAYEITYGETTVNASGAAGATTHYTVTGLTANTAYTFSIVAKDAKGNAAAPVVVNATTDDFAAAADPTHAAADVKSIYSDTYGNISGLNINPNWGQATACSEVMVGENHIISMAHLNYQGIEFQKFDATEFDTLHVDVYTLGATSLVIVPIWRKEDNSGNCAEITYTASALVPGQWNALDIPLSAFASVDRNGSNLLYQIKFDGGQNKDYFVDNIYLYKEATGAPTAVENVVADEVVKFMQNGQLFIMKNGVLYNAMGQMVK